MGKQLTRNQLMQVLRLQKEIARKKARAGSFIDLCKLLKSDYRPKWFHNQIAAKLHRFLNDPDRKRLGIFLPPQHGKSELTTNMFPTNVLGHRRNTRIAICAYNTPFASKFNRAVQRYIDTDEFKSVFPETRINSRNVVTTQSWLRNQTEFEVIGTSGSLISTGIGGGLSGRPVDLGIIDDPIKDYKEAISETSKEAVWNWYLSVFSTRLHNDSKQIIITTRWAEDDLAGRLLNPELNPFYEDWEVISYEAIREDMSDPDDPREFGEALWPERHNLERLNKLRSLNPSIFQSLYQQSPNTKEGTTIKRSYFEIVDELPLGYFPADLWIDTSDSERLTNDPNGFIVHIHDQYTGTVYLLDAQSELLELPERLEKINEYTVRYNMSNDSRIRIEPKSSGKATKQMHNNQSGHITAVDIDSYLVNESKKTKYGVAATYIKQGRVKLLRGSWNKKYIDQMVSEKPKNDEFRDLTGYICDKCFGNEINAFTNPVGASNLI